MPDPQRILLIRPSALGDVCRTVPVLASLRRAWPDARVDWIVQDDFADAVAAHPDLGRLIRFPRRRWARWWLHPSAARDLFAWLRALRRTRYDLVLDCQGLGRSGFMAWVTRAPRRLGHRDAREGAWLGYTHRIRVDANVHTVDRMLALVQAAGAEPVADMRLFVPRAHRDAWAARRAALGLDDARSVVLAPTSRWPSKRWPDESWVGLLEPLARAGFDRCILIGAPGERDQVPGLGAAANGAGHAIDLIGETTVGGTMAVIEQASLLIANDSAPLHMAVGLDRPCIGLYGPTDPDLVGPYSPRAVTLRRAAPDEIAGAHYRDRKLGDRLMQAITIDDVMAAAEALAAPAASGGAAATPARVVTARRDPAP